MYRLATIPVPADTSVNVPGTTTWIKDGAGTLAGRPVAVVEAIPIAVPVGTLFLILFLLWVEPTNARGRRPVVGFTVSPAPTIYIPIGAEFDGVLADSAEAPTVNPVTGRPAGAKASLGSVLWGINTGKDKVSGVVGAATVTRDVPV